MRIYTPRAHEPRRITRGELLDMLAVVLSVALVVTVAGML